MAKTFGSLGDFFPDTDLCCRIRGCGNVWQFSGEEALHNVAEGKSSRPERMCDDCFSKYQELSDRDVPCSRPGCEKTWVWNRFQQLEAQVRGFREPPRGLCSSCRSEMDQTKDKALPCRIRGCKGTWIWRARDQLLNPRGGPPRRLCEACFRRLKQLEDEAVECRVRHCRKTWTWNRYQQLEHAAAGRGDEPPPRRMCDDCYELFRTLADLELPCKIKECQRTWTYTTYEQLERRLEASEGAGEGTEAPSPPSRMCKECYRFFRRTADREVGCRNRGCSKTWTYARSMQLYDWLKGRKRPPQLMCADCRRRLNELKEREMPCMVPGCARTWSYPAIDQLKNELAGKLEDSRRRCRECEEFLAGHDPLLIPCEHCGTEIRWSSYEQLLCERGTFVKPSMCTSCAQQELALGTPKKPKKRAHHHVVKIPSAGRWHEDPRVHDWPPHMTYESIEGVENADVRIVAIGDDLTLSADSAGAAWPALLEGKLNEALPRGKKAVVVNAGIAGCTSQQGFLRFARDVEPFAPQVVLFSFAFADALVKGLRAGGEPRYNIEPSAAAEGLDRFLRALRALDCRVLYWTANPVFPEESHRLGKDGPWVRAQTGSTDHILRAYRHTCMQAEIPVLDLYSRFVVNGTSSAKKWMRNWYMHNETGARNIATWFAGHLLHGDFLPA